MLPKKSSFVRKNVMIWQKYGAIENVRHSGKKGRKADRKLTQSDGGGRVAANKGDSTHSKNRDFTSDVLFEWPLWC